MKKTVTVLIGYGSPTLTGLKKLENMSEVIANSTLFSSKLHNFVVLYINKIRITFVY
jgi:hypothetical protein